MARWLPFAALMVVVEFSILRGRFKPVMILENPQILVDYQAMPPHQDQSRTRTKLAIAMLRSQASLDN